MPQKEEMTKEVTFLSIHSLTACYFMVHVEKKTCSLELLLSIVLRDWNAVQRGLLLWCYFARRRKSSSLEVCWGTGKWSPWQETTQDRYTRKYTASTCATEKKVNSQVLRQFLLLLFTRLYVSLLYLRVVELLFMEVRSSRSEFPTVTSDSRTTRL